jgi:hypothetical protein
VEELSSLPPEATDKFPERNICSLSECGLNILYIDILVNKTLTRALLDTGSSISCVCSRLIQNSYSVDPLKIKGVTGSDIVSRKSKLRLIIGKETIEFPAYVYDTNHPLIF